MDAQDKALGERIVGRLREAGISAGADGTLHIGDRDGGAPGQGSTQYVFDDANLIAIAAKTRGAGTDRLEMTFTGNGPKDFLATFSDGRPAQKPVDGPWIVDHLRFSQIDTASAEEFAEPDPDSIGDVLDIRGKSLDARVTCTSTLGTGEEQRPVVQIKVEMCVRRSGGGLLRELTGDEYEDREILTEELLVDIAKMVGQQGTLFLVRPSESEQLDLFSSADPVPPPEGFREKTLRRGTKRAVEVLESAVSAAKPDGTPVDLEVVRQAYQEDPVLMLRTWDGGPVKVMRDFRCLYVLRLPEKAAEPEDADAPDGAANQGEE